VYTAYFSVSELDDERNVQLSLRSGDLDIPDDALPLEPPEGEPLRRIFILRTPEWGGRNRADDVQLFDITPVDAAIEQLIEFVDCINGLNGIQNALDSKLGNALDAWLAENAEQRNDAIKKMESFIIAVEAQRAKKISDVEADSLVEQALRIIDSMIAYQP